jgi:molybdenum cofactor biosynthesis enzyme MoaA
MGNILRLLTDEVENDLVDNEGHISSDAYSIEYSLKSQISQKLRLSVTDGCNFNCFFCHNEGQGHVTTNTGHMSVAEITKIIHIALHCGVRSIKLTGGEPLIYRHGGANIVDLVASITDLKKLGFDFSLSLITNGYLLSRYATDLKNAGLDYINISLSTLNQSTFHKFIRQANKGDIGKVVEGIRAAVAAGISPVKVNMVLFYSVNNDVGNIREVPQIIDVCKNLGVDELRLYTLLWHARFSEFEEYYHYWDSEILPIIDLLGIDVPNELKQQVLADLRAFAKNWSQLVYPKARMVIKCDGLPVAFETMMLGRFGEDAPCDDCEHPQLCQEGPYALRVSAQGEVRGCLLSKTAINLIDGIRTGLPDDELVSQFKSGLSLLPRNGDRVYND